MHKDSPVNRLVALLADKGCTRILVKKLADNDNSKNQVYLGMGFEAINFFPNLKIQPDKNGLFKAYLRFSWIDPVGYECPAPTAKLILYPQYPEVRFSGFLKGCRNAPSGLMAPRMAGRLLFLGIRPDGQIFGHVVAASDRLAVDFLSLGELPQAGVFSEIHISDSALIADSKSLLLKELKRIHKAGWIDSKRLDSQKHILPCLASNCGGYTLEAELGIIPNGISDPDFLGWEVKQHHVTKFANYRSGILTLMTPEPKGGYYRDRGVEAFIIKYGYADKTGRADRFNFGGIHVAGKQHAATGLSLELLGYDSKKRKITDENGSVALVKNGHEIAAAWFFADLLTHWNRKHNQAVYVPSMKRNTPNLQYSYGNMIRLCEGTDFLKLLSAFADGKVYYDPGIKLENASDPHRKKTKRRSQFRVKSRDIPALYKLITPIDIG
jgi:hypothetical protein